MMKARRHRGRQAAVVALLIASLSAPAFGRDFAACASGAETVAFRLRHLQSQLMVAGLSCNQQAAYNTFVEKFRERLAAAGGEVVGYFRRSGGGERLLNKHITDLANAAGIIRAAGPTEFCADTWSIFLTLQDHPDDLEVLANAHTLAAVPQPALCDGGTPGGQAPIVNAASPISPARKSAP
jgi:hypothetical protein